MSSMTQALATPAQEQHTALIGPDMDGSACTVTPQQVETPVSANADYHPQARVQNIYGSFKLADSEFALRVDFVQEVVNEPELYHPVPLSPDYLLGLFNLRGLIIPVVDMRRIFKLDGISDTVDDMRKVAILVHDGVCLGLLFDSTSEVFNANDVEHCLFEKRTDAPQEQVVQGVFKADEGRRIIQILDMSGLLNLDQLPRSASHVEDQRKLKRRGVRRQCISFNVGDSSCALDISAIREIVNIGIIENQVLAGALCLGAIDLRGTTVPVVNFSALLGYPDLPVHEISEADSHRVIIMSVDNNLFGLLVSHIESIVPYYSDELMTFPAPGNKKAAMFTGCIALTDESVDTILLNHDNIFSHDEIQSITRGHSQLFSESQERQAKKSKGALNRRTLITFTLDQRYALDINEVNEIIDLPVDLIQTPNMSDSYRGVSNLRGEMIAIIDSHQLYGLEPCEKGQGKVLVFEVQGQKQGLMVNSIDAIVQCLPDDIINVPEFVFPGSTTQASVDTREAIMIEQGNDKHTVCVVDLNAIAERAKSA